jgi:hypothetical protein
LSVIVRGVARQLHPLQEAARSSASAAASSTRPIDARRRQPAAHLEADRQDATGGARHGTILAVEDRDRGRLVQLVGHALEDRLGHAGDARRRQVGLAEREDRGRQLVAAAAGGGVAEHRQRVHAAPRRRARQPGEPRDVRDRELRAAVAEGADRRQAAGQRQHEIRVADRRLDGVAPFEADRPGRT